MNPHARFYVDVKDEKGESHELEPRAGQPERPSCATAGRYSSLKVGRRGYDSGLCARKTASNMANARVGEAGRRPSRVRGFVGRRRPAALREIAGLGGRPGFHRAPASACAASCVGVSRKGPNMTRISSGVVSCFVVVAAAVALAQQTPPDATSPAGSGVRTARLHRPQVQRRICPTARSICPACGRAAVPSVISPMVSPRARRCRFVPSSRQSWKAARPRTIPRPTV